MPSLCPADIIRSKGHVGGRAHGEEGRGDNPSRGAVGPHLPVVGFWEAEACCAWAGGRLPREQEWEAAARGREGHAYPWGNDWHDGICNTDEAGLGITSPVGLFPRARQAELDTEDLAGNVGEWCGSLYDPPDINDPNARRALRGGPWHGSSDNARPALRGWDDPSYRSDGFGFRVVCSSPINEP